MNEASFPSVLLRPGERYAHTMLHAFSCGAPAGTELKAATIPKKA